MTTNGVPDAIEVRRAVGGRLRELRLARGLIQKEAAEIAGLKERQYRSVEKGESQQAFYNVLRLARYYHEPLDDLVGV